MAQQQQTVLRVQTNVPDDLISYQSGYTSISRTMSIVSYSGTGISDDPYISSTTTGVTLFTFSVIGRDGIFYYDYSGTGVMSLGVNFDNIRIDNNTRVTGNIAVKQDDNVYIDLDPGCKLNNVYFVPVEEVVYKYEFLDLYGDIPIKINKSFAELQDISKRNSDYSIGLQLPGSKKNNRFFESFFNVDVDTLYFNPLTRVPCNVLINDQSYFMGYLKLNKISVLNSKVEYDVTLFSNVADLYGKIGNNLLKDLNYNDPSYLFNHEFNKFQVQNWDVNPFSRPDPQLYFYPIVHNGYEYSGDTVNLSGATVSGQTRLYTSTIVSGYTSFAAAYAAGVKRYRLNSPQDGLLDNQLKPALNIKSLIELMFKTYGYTIDSDFFNTPWFKLLYMYGYFSSDSTKFSYKTPVPQTLSIDGVNVIFVETFVDSSEFPCGPQYFKTDRTYTIYVVKAGSGIPCLCSSPINLNLAFRLYPCTGGAPSDFTVPVTIPANSTGTTYSWVSNQYVDCGSGCPFQLEYTQNFVDQTTGDVAISAEPLAYTPQTPNTTLYFEDGDFVDFSLVIDPNIKQIDLLSSIAKKFNLVFVPNPEKPNEIKIEPYTYYIGTGNIYDWTDKLSYDKGFTVEPAQNYVESELILTDQEDGDYGNKTFKDQNNRIYGQNFIYNSTDFKSQQKKIDTIFSPELLRQWDTPDTAPNGEIKLPLGINYAASSNSQSSGNTEKVTWQYKGVKTKPKIFYNLGFFNPFLDTLGEVINFNYVLTNQVYIAESNGANPRGRFVVPIVSHTMPIGNPDSNKINNDSISVLFNSEQPVDIGVTPFDVYTENDSYNLFYSNRINNVYNKNTRFLGGYFDLKLSDIQNLQAKDIIRIKDQYFTWNKISDYNLTNPELTKVELIQFNNQVNEYPTRYFKYYYCDNPGTVFKFKTDMTNPSLVATNYGWSIYYDYSIGILINAGETVLTGFTACVRDIEQDGDYVPYTIYEVSENNYNSSGIDRIYDKFYLNIRFDFAGELDEVTYPSYIYGTSQIIYNLFEDCVQFNSAASTYGIATGSSTYYGPPVVPTPTPTATPAPTPTPTLPMIGSLMITFDEVIPGNGGTYYNVLVNNQDRQLNYLETNNLYSTHISPGDVVKVEIQNNITTGETYSVVRRDYTTDDTLGNMGIVDTIIVTATGGTNASVTFTATTLNSSYNFEYLVLVSFGGLPNYCIWGENDLLWINNSNYWGSCSNVPILAKGGAFGANQKIACRGDNPLTVYYTGATFGLGTLIYTDPALTTPVSNGWFSDFSSLYRVLGGSLFSTEPCPACLEDPKNINWRMDYSYTSDNVTGFTLSEFEIRNYPMNGDCVGGFSTPIDYFTPGTYVNYSGLTGSTNWSGSTTFDGQTVGLRQLVVDINICYQPSIYPSIMREGSTVSLYINNIFVKNYDYWWNNNGSLYLNTMTPCSGLTQYTRTSVYFDNVTINENDNVKIVFDDNFVTPYNKNEFEYIWTNSRTNSRIISGYTFGDGYYIPNFIRTVTGTTGTYSTGQYTSQLPLSSAQLFFSVSNSGLTDTILTRTIKLFQNGIEQTGYTVTQTGGTVPVTPSNLLRFYTNWPASVANSQIVNKWQITDDFTQPTPTPTPTSTPTPTPTPTPNPATIAYQYIGTSTNGATTKTASNLRINSGSGGSLLMTRTDASFTSSTNTTSGTTVIDNSFVGTPLNLQVLRTITKTGSSSEYITTRTFQIYRNGVLEISFNSTTDFTVPLSPSNLPQDYVFPTAITINPGDAIVVRWNDTII